ncbi:hypothetical protein SAMN06264364_1051 [Quadrisphaera granulorum]|uniref:Antitoxin n=1 Tax=Quadrisphaera granulorum TaxID=317664 RepID=A0A316AX70_9ACTN|nr:hypothetical protein BXY45_1051 [Quadrisphaera granulorum]SZE95743.1 hypothetical protein SAMN06264364_1051 [Quadrisphaera granulorum]
MRTTIDLPDDVHRAARAVARDAGTTLSEAVIQLLRSALGAPGPVSISTDRRTGLPLISAGRSMSLCH